MTSVPMRGFLGFAAGVIAVLIFHQGMIAALHTLAPGWVPFVPYRTMPVPPFGVPAIVSNCVWGGVWGAAFAIPQPRYTWPMWLCGVVLGILAGLVGLFIVAPLKGLPIAARWMPLGILRSLLINGFWGFGVGLILPLLMPRSLVRAHT